jgi:hypothetical protein
VSDKAGRGCASTLTRTVVWQRPFLRRARELELRVHSHTHGGVAGLGGQPPLCRWFQSRTLRFALEPPRPFGRPLLTLHFLAVEGFIEGVRFLAGCGADVNAAKKFGDAPLIDLARLGEQRDCSDCRLWRGPWNTRRRSHRVRSRPRGKPVQLHFLPEWVTPDRI